MPTRQGQVPDAIFPSTPLGVPILDRDLAAFWVEAPVRGWGSVSRRSRMRGTWHFYVDDYKFATLYRDPSSVTLSRAVAAVEPNYTIGDQMPYPVALHRIYKKRWVNRYWQTLGLMTFVDLSVPQEYEDLNLEGVPDGWAAFATKAADSRLDELERHYATACDFNPKPVFLIYGGGRKVEALARKLGAVFIKTPGALLQEAKKANG